MSAEVQELHILVVEDDKAMQENIQGWLKQFKQIQLIYVGNITDAEKALKERQFAAMITDNQLPATADEKVTESKNPGPGILLIRKLRSGKLGKRNRNIPVMFESGDRDQFGLATAEKITKRTNFSPTVVRTNYKYYSDDFIDFVKNDVLNPAKAKKPPETGVSP